MFKVVAESTRPLNTPASEYRAILDFPMREFVDIKYLLDPPHEEHILGELLFYLTAYSLAAHEEYAERYWSEAYRTEPYDLIANETEYGFYYDGLINLIDVFKRGGEVHFEMIRMLISYMKVRGHDPEILLNKYLKSRRAGYK